MHTRECTGTDPIDGRALDDAVSDGGKRKGINLAGQSKRRKNHNEMLLTGASDRAEMPGDDESQWKDHGTEKLHRCLLRDGTAREARESRLQRERTRREPEPKVVQVHALSGVHMRATPAQQREVMAMAEETQAVGASVPSGESRALEFAIHFGTAPPAFP